MAFRKWQKSVSKKPADNPINTNKFSTEKPVISKRDWNRLSKQEKFLYNLKYNSNVLLNGMNDGPFARIIGVHGNHSLDINYGPNAYEEMTNHDLKKVPSLYEYQLNKRFKK